MMIDLIIKNEEAFASFVSNLMKNIELTSTQRLVLISIAMKMLRNHGRCIMSSKEIAEASSVTSRTAKTTVSQLEDLGYLKIQERFDENKANLVNEYFLRTHSEG